MWGLYSQLTECQISSDFQSSRRDEGMRELSVGIEANHEALVATAELVFEVEHGFGKGC